MAGTEPERAASGRWIEVSVEVDTESVDAVAEFLSRRSYNQGVVIQESFAQDDDGDNWRIEGNRPVTLSAYVPANQFDQAMRDSLEQGLWHLGRLGTVGELRTREIEEEDWANSWKEFFPVTRIGRHFVIQPSWREFEAGPDDVVIKLDPGMAFGTGLHPTTDLCLCLLETLDVQGKHVLDAGAGSGILSVAALKLGARSVDSLEIDPVAVSALAQNVALNGFDRHIRVLQGDITREPPSDEPYDLVLANILSRILIEAAPQLRQTTAANGTVILSGIIEAHEADVVAAFAGEGFRIVGRRVSGDWVALVARRSA